MQQSPGVYLKHYWREIEDRFFSRIDYRIWHSCAFVGFELAISASLKPLIDCVTKFGCGADYMNFGKEEMVKKRDQDAVYAGTS